MTVMLATLAMLVPAPVDHHDVCHSLACEERVARKQCWRGEVTRCIDRAAMRWRVSAAMLKRKAWCESRYNPFASNGTHFGLFQFLPSTYATTPYVRRGSVWSAKWNSLAAAWMHHVGRGGEWACR